MYFGLVKCFFWFESVAATVVTLSVLKKKIKNGNYDKEAHWRSFLWGRSGTRRSRPRFRIKRNTVIKTEKINSNSNYSFPIDATINNFLLWINISITKKTHKSMLTLQKIPTYPKYQLSNETIQYLKTPSFDIWQWESNEVIWWNF